MESRNSKESSREKSLALTSLWGMVKPLLVSPCPRTLAEYEIWRNDELVFLQAKAASVKPLSPNQKEQMLPLVEVVDRFFTTELNGWWERRGLPSAMDLAQKLELLNKEFSQILAEMEKIGSGSQWLDLLQQSQLPNYTLIANLSYVDLFSWILPHADPEDADQYEQLGRIMTIFFFREAVYKREFQMSNDSVRESQMYDLQKFLARYRILQQCEVGS